MMAKKYYIGVLILVVLISSIYIMLPNKIRIDVTKTRTQYKVFENGSWVLAATEYVNLFDGSKKMRASSRALDWQNDSGIITVKRYANYKDNINTIDTYVFDSNIPDIELVPVSHSVDCVNCKGKILHFEYRDILYTGETKVITSPFNFGHNMKLEWQEGSYLSKVYVYKFASPKIWIRYRPQTDYETYLVRLFDPVPSGVIGSPSIYHNWDSDVYEDKLVAFYRFDNESEVGENDTLSFDWSGEGNNGTITDAVYNLTNKTLGDGAIDLNGTANYIDISTMTGLSNRTFTLSAWIKNKGSGDAQQIMYAYSTGTGDERFRFRLTSSGVLNVLNDFGLSFSCSGDLRDNSWHFVTFTYDSINQNASLYQDGTWCAQDIIFTNTTEVIGLFHIGSRTGASLFFNGTIDELMIFNRSLSASEISDIYTQQKDNCVIPYEDMSIVSDTTLCEGTYYLNDTGGDGAIKFGANNVKLDCNGVNLIGNFSSDSFGIFSNIRDNVTIKNCNVYNYSTNIRLRKTTDSFAINNTLYNASDKGVWLLISSSNNTVENNTFIDNRFGLFVEDSNNTIVKNNDVLNSSSRGMIFTDTFFTNITDNFVFLNGTHQLHRTTDTRGIFVNGIGGNLTIKHNVVIGSTYPIRLDDNNPYSNISFNNVSIIGTWGIAVKDNSSFSVICNNRVINGSWNLIYFGSWNNIICDNYQDNYLHHGTDAHSDFNETLSGNNSIFGNIINQSSSDFASGDSGIFIQSSSFNLIYNNTLVNLVNTTIAQTDSRGIKIDGGNYSIDNLVYNNTLNNISGYCLYDSSNNTLWENNNLTNCDDSVRVLTLSSKGFVTTFASFKDNFHTSGIATYWSSNQQLNFTVNETSVSYHLINLSNDGTIQFIGNFRKDFRVENETISIVNMVAPYNDVFNQTSESVLALNQDTYNVTIAPNNEIRVGDFTLFDELIVTVSPNISQLIYNPNWSILNWSNIINISTGNYTWNFSEEDIPTYNITDWLFNVSNNATSEMQVQLKLNETKKWWDWYCNNTKVLTTFTNIIKIPGNTHRFFNCTINTINITQTYIDWSIQTDESEINVTYTFNATNT